MWLNKQVPPPHAAPAPVGSGETGQGRGGLSEPMVSDPAEMVFFVFCFCLFFNEAIALIERRRK